MQGKVALVTGSTSGIGLGIAHRLANAGAHIMFNGFGDQAEINKTVSDVANRYGVQTSFYPADVSKPDDWAAMVAKAEADLGPVDILVNNAGIQFTAKAHEFPAEKWNAIIGINLSGAFWGVQATLPGMLERNWGRIINIASAHGLVASVEKSAYVAAKHGLVGLTKVLALETAQTGVTANAICPGWVLTPLVAAQIQARADDEGKSFDEAKIDLLAEKQPSLEFVTPEQLGDFAVFLSSDGAAQLTGQAMAMDGGWTAR